jgi:hypothetical protein
MLHSISYSLPSGFGVFDRGAWYDQYVMASLRGLPIWQSSSKRCNLGEWARQVQSSANKLIIIFLYSAKPLIP